MSLISEQVKNLRYLAMEFGGYSNNYKLLNDAADTIEELSAKLANANMERYEQHYDNDMLKVVRCKDCIYWGAYKVLGETDTMKCCGNAHYFSRANGYCAYGGGRSDMTELEAINIIKNARPPKDMYKRMNEAFDMAITSLEKQEAKEAVYHDNCDNPCTSARCPRCFEIISSDYCGYCGQRVR